MATDGQFIASPQTIELLSSLCQIPNIILRSDSPSIIANQSKSLIQPAMDSSSLPPMLDRYTHFNNSISVYDDFQVQCQTLTDGGLSQLCRHLALYVHPVMRAEYFDEADHEADGNIKAEYCYTPMLCMTNTRRFSRSRQGYRRRQRAEAELRSVYVMFMKALIPVKVTGDDDKDKKLFETLQRIMTIALREIKTYNGRIRQFIVDDKGEFVRDITSS